MVKAYRTLRPDSNISCRLDYLKTRISNGQYYLVRVPFNEHSLNASRWLLVSFYFWYSSSLLTSCFISPAIGRIAKDFFEHVGLVSVARDSNCPIKDIDEATNIGIEVGASDVDESISDGRNVFRVSVKPCTCFPTE